MKRLAAPLAVGLILAVVALFGAFEPFDEKLFGFWLRQRNQNLSQADLGSLASDLVLVAIDGATVSTWGATLPPDVWSEIVRRLDKAGVTTIALNNLFVEDTPEPLVAGLREQLANPRVVLQYALDVHKGKLVRVLPDAPLLEGWAPAEVQSRLGFTAAPGLAGQLRAVWLRIEQGEEVFQAWPVVVLAHHLQTTPAGVLEKVQAASHITKVNSQATVRALEAWPNFPAPGMDSAHNLDNLLTELSLKQLLDMPEEQLPGMFGRPRRLIALVGAVESGSARMFHTLAGRLSGPQIQAVTILNLANNNFILPETVAEELLLILGSALLVGVLGGRFGPRAGLATAAGAAPCLVWASYGALASPAFTAGRLIPVLGPVTSLVATACALALLERGASERQRQDRVMGAFERFSPRGPLQGTPLLMWVELQGLVRCADQLGSSWTFVADFAAEVAGILERFGGRLTDTRAGTLVVAFGLEQPSRGKPAAAACGAGAAILADFKLRSPHWAEAGPSGQGLRISIGLRNLSRGLPGKALVISEPVRLQAEEYLRCQPVAGGYLVTVDETLTLIKLNGTWHADLQRVPEAHCVQLGDTLGPYRIESLIGEGGMGVVFLALDTRLLRKVAVKVMTGNIDGSEAERFLAEARAVARVQHPGIVAIYDIEVSPVLYLAMEYASGKTLREVIESQAPLTPERAVALAVEILEALAAVHEHRIVHRDLKPANIMVDDQDHIKLMDFGLARFLEDDRRLTKLGDICGTPEYMAPEHLDGGFGEVDELTDLFAVGTILYEMLSGALPVRDSSVAATMHDLLNVVPEQLARLNPRVEARLEAVVQRALSKVKADRFQSAREFLAALRGL